MKVQENNSNPDKLAEINDKPVAGKQGAPPKKTSQKEYTEPGVLKHQVIITS